MKTILLIDHDAEHLAHQTGVLGRAGYRVVTVQDAGSALFILESGMLVDLIVTEYTVPDMAFGEWLAALRDASPDAQVIVVTHCDSAECHLRATNMGVYEYLSKPVQPGRLHGIVRRAFRAGPDRNRFACSA